jgi:hypothetical protein
MLCSSLGQAQLLRYQVFKSKKEIGTMTVSRVSSLSEVTYENITEVRYKILIELEIKYVLQETFEQGILMRGHGFSSLNGSKKTTYDIVKKEEGYVLRAEDIPQRLPFETIIYSAAKIHFEEPWDQQAVFSQHFVTYLNFEEINPHYYLLTSPQGENYYRYENGICTEVTVIRDFGTLYFNLMPESYVIVNTPDSLRNK